MKRRTLSLALGLLLLPLGGAVWALGDPCPGAGQTVAVAPAALRPRVVARAVVSARDGLVEVRTRVSGTVRAVLVRPGEAVAAGQLLAELEAEDLQRALEEAEAEREALEAQARVVAEGARPEEREAAEADVAAARADMSLAEDREARETRLGRAEVTSDWERTQARSGVALAGARLAAAEARARLASAGGRPGEVEVARARAAAAAARVALLRAQLGWTRLVAPAAGVVQARRLDPGDVVHPGPGPALFELADPTRTELRVEVEERDAGALAAGQEVTVTARGGGPALATGRLVRLAPALERRTIGAEEARVRADASVRAGFVEWEGPAPDLPIGLRLEAVIAGPPRQVAAAVPRAAVRLVHGQALVRTPFGPLWRDRRVDLGLADAQWVEVRGLVAGQAVLVSRE